MKRYEEFDGDEVCTIRYELSGSDVDEAVFDWLEANVEEFSQLDGEVRQRMWLHGGRIVRRDLKE